MKLSVRKLILTDYLSCGACIMISVFWLMSLLIPEERQTLFRDPGWIVWLGIVTALLSAVIVWRIYRASRLFRSGQVAAGHITTVSVGLKGPNTIDFAFDLEGRRVRARMYVMGWKKVPALKRGQTVDVLYDPAHPTRAIIPLLFQA
jgi:hypothetical protein